jgi:hypothetical protein
MKIVKIVLGFFIAVAALCALLVVADCQPPEGVVAPDDCHGEIRVMSDCGAPNDVFCACVGKDGVIESLVEGPIEMVFCNPNCEPYGKE